MNHIRTSFELVLALCTAALKNQLKIDGGTVYANTLYNLSDNHEYLSVSINTDEKVFGYIGSELTFQYLLGIASPDWSIQVISDSDPFYQREWLGKRFTVTDFRKIYAAKLAGENHTGMYVPVWDVNDLFKHKEGEGGITPR